MIEVNEIQNLCDKLIILDDEIEGEIEDDDEIQTEIIHFE